MVQEQKGDFIHKQMSHDPFFFYKKEGS